MADARIVSAKQQKMFSISISIFKLEAQRGHLQWKVTELVPRSGVSRTLIYRYFGSSREKILDTAVEVFCQEFYGFSRGRSALNFYQKIREARGIVSGCPEAILFYQKWRASDSPYRAKFQAVEEKFRQKLKKLFPHKDDIQILAIHACIHGLVTSPFLTLDQAEEAGRYLIGKDMVRG